MSSMPTIQNDFGAALGTAMCAWQARLMNSQGILICLGGILIDAYCQYD
jgi:hypothetical protein